MTIYLLTSEPHKKHSSQIEAIEAKLATLVPAIRKIRRIEDVAAVANGGLAQGPVVVADGVDGELQVGQAVEGVEDAEEVDAGLGPCTGDVQVVQQVLPEIRVNAAKESSYKADTSTTGLKFEASLRDH